MRAKKRELCDKLTTRGGVAMFAAYIAGSIVDKIEAGAGTIFVIWGMLYACFCAYRGLKILTHKINKK